MKRVAIIGSSGHYGRAMIRELRSANPKIVIHGIDVVDPPEWDTPDFFFRCDARSEALIEAMVEFEPDTVLHLAFVVNPIHNDEKMHDINVAGTRNVLKAVAKIQPERLLISSSATAYGAWPDNPIPLLESQPLRAREEYRYSADKVEVEEMLVDFAKTNPEIATSWTRPTIIYETGLTNYLTTFVAKPPALVMPNGSNTPMQFVHADDVVAATRLILEKKATGPFNIGPKDWVSLSEMAEMSSRPIFSLPLAILKGIASMWWALRLPLFRFPPGLWYFAAYPWVISPERLTEELGYEFRYSCRDTLQLMFDDLR